MHVESRRTVKIHLLCKAVTEVQTKGTNMDTKVRRGCAMNWGTGLDAYT